MPRLFKTAKFQKGKFDIDPQAGIIRGVSVMTIGPALGHGIDIDRTGLEQCLAACRVHGDEGVKLIFKHDGEMEDIEGAIKNFQIIGDKLIGDIYLLDTAPDRQRILELAEKMPSQFGLSVETAGEDEVVPNSKKKLYRCAEIFAIALVPEPAANPTGLFQRKPKTNMDEEQLKKMFGQLLEEALTPINERLSKLEEPKPEPEPEPTPEPDPEPTPEPEPKPETDEEKLARLAAAAATEAVTKLAAKFGMKRAPVATDPGTAKSKLTKFQALVKKHEAAGSKSPFAAAIKENPQAYNEHIESMNQGGW